MNTLLDFLSKATPARDLAVAGLGLAAAWLAFVLARRVLVSVMTRISRRTSFTLDNRLVESGVFARLALVAPALVLGLCADLLPGWAEAVRRLSSVLFLLAGASVADGVLSALAALYQERPRAARRPIKGPVQLVRIFLWVLALVAAVAFVLGTSPWGLLSGIGAFTAVLLLVFRDTILSFVAGMQIVLGDLVRKGDWLEVPAFGADGDVIEIELHVVQVRNWDKTIVTIPTWKLMDGGFKNWRGMQEAGGRRIKRSLIIDQTSVNFADGGLLESLKGITLLRPYLEERGAEIDAENARRGVAQGGHPLNGRRMTNLGCFRAYVRLYLRNHPEVHQGLTMLVRQLDPTDEGLPLEVYCFTTVTGWGEYEDIQSDIFDHLLSALPWFGLRVYQRVLTPDTRIPDALR
ncbi:MAG: mechanosensitive ion channel family protein [Desulfovibrionaceae bacterium]